MTELILTNVSKYQAFFVKAFSKYLSDAGSSKKTITNYVSDIKFFFDWILSTFEAIGAQLPTEPVSFIQTVNEDIIENYKLSLVLQKTPVSTINRHLSSLRIFFRFCISNSWITSNPCEKVSNIPKIKPMLGMSSDHISYLLFEYGNDLLLEHVPQLERENQISEIKNFMYWLHTKKLPHAGEGT